jgi:hypothetical protein
VKPVNTQEISSILDDYLADNPQLAIQIAENRAINAWNSLLGATVARYTSNLYVQNRKLYAKITSPVLKSELTLCRGQLVRRLNEKAGRNVIDDIIFR